jgi:O-antigen ligase
MKLVAQALYAAAVLAIPLDVVLRFQLLGYNARLSHLLFALLLVVAVAAGLRSSAWRRVRVPIAAAAYLLVVVASVPGSLNPTKTAGYAAWALFDVAALLVGLPLLLRVYPSVRGWLVGTHLASAVLVCVTAFGEVAAFSEGGPRPASAFIGAVMYPRLQAFFYEPAYLAFFLVGATAVAWAWYLFDDAAPRTRLLFVTVICSVTVILSTARSGWLALVAAYAAPALIAARMSAPRRQVLRGTIATGAASILVAVVVLGGYVVAKTGGPPEQRLAAIGAFAADFGRFQSGQGTEGSTELRVTGSAIGLQVWSEHPLLGVGIGGFGAYVIDRGYVAAGPDPSKVIAPNLWVELLAETGILGLAAALALLLSIALGALRSRSRLAAAYGVAILVIALVSFQFNQNFLRLDLWLLLGLASAYASSD